MRTISAHAALPVSGLAEEMQHTQPGTGQTAPVPGPTPGAPVEKQRTTQSQPGPARMPDPTPTVPHKDPTPSELRALRAAFRRVDRNGDGVLTRAEIIDALRSDAETRRLLDIPMPTEEELQEAFKTCWPARGKGGGDSSRNVSFQGFTTMVMQMQAMLRDVD